MFKSLPKLCLLSFPCTFRELKGEGFLCTFFVDKGEISSRGVSGTMLQVTFSFWCNIILHCGFPEVLGTWWTSGVSGTLKSWNIVLVPSYGVGLDIWGFIGGIAVCFAPDLIKCDGNSCVIWDSFKSWSFRNSDDKGCWFSFFMRTFWLDSLSIFGLFDDFIDIPA